jgi:hypothetical protein
MIREINLHGLIPPLEDCQGAYIERRISSEIGMKLYETGSVVLYVDNWSPQHLSKILEKCREKGYTIIDQLDSKDHNHHIIRLPEFDIVEKKIHGGEDA